MIYKNTIIAILLLPMLGSLIGWLIGRKSEAYRDTFNILLTGAEFLIINLIFKRIATGPVELFIPDIMGIGLSLKLDIFRYIFIWVTSLIWFLTTIYSTQYLIRYKNRNRYYAFFMLTLGSTIGIFLSENLINLFTFFEIMSFTSYALVIHDEDEYAHEAGRSYISMAIIGGLILLMGLFLLYDYLGTVDIRPLSMAMKDLGNIKYLISALLIIGFGVKASIVPLHVWLPKAHPAAPTPASAILSGILVKTGIFGIIVVVSIMMNGDMVLSTVILIIGFINMFLGGFLAMFQRNIKRILAYSSMSQIGYILMGIGLIGLLKEHNAIAVYATLYHIFNHALFKVLLFLCAGVIYMILHELSINAIRGFGKHKNILKILFLIGLFAIIGMPGFNGFISKTLLHEALAEAHHMYHNMWFNVAEVIFTISSSFTVAYLLKIFVAVFMEKSDKYKGQYKHHLKKRAMIPMVALSVVIIYIGLRPNIILKVLEGTMVLFNAHEHIEPHFYNIHNIKSSMITIGFGFIIFIGFISRYLRKEENGEPVYVNPSLKWFSLERHLYIPVARFLYRSSSMIFKVIDRGIINLVMYVSNSLKALSGIKVKKPSKAIENLKIKKPNVLVRKNNKNEFTTFSDILEILRFNLNSLMYGVFILAIMIIVVLGILVF
ncbi:complex I subunit 5 family protein [Paramaledivibacter caminithermalis]|jgi:formate hydrogenlyase subunit 3/multisubunit Na+/H+ antiporter MnhD subunit|uniref:Formate hydrogenlyase subunit 3/Multisubunit Na+/H+ antiporter, MnhD subunit n=1 Tax=Paramaledivibacter caminithermalis (strain DSM 15212 / CIP 107654 / DViRD3) TaxID=1121301 RepID=A0A1M6NZH7_PARC5|nr:proton-conducting transporter membrane subunit [Paramaledivibacter caminithermalis]SHK01058.1 Formate hydrogenlyase subunit 3/Multisubunit Na+/H+ antiporter, MnhD subunit [Paramaledivibacter caminithermalis DSM 15212]